MEQQVLMENTAIDPMETTMENITLSVATKDNVVAIIKPIQS